MDLGLNLSLNRMVGRRNLPPGPATNPRAAVIAALFGGGEQGCYFARVDSYYADNALTTLAGPSDPIQAYKDLSGNGFHLAANAESNRPLNDGGIARFDGADDGVDRRADGTDPYGAVDDSFLTLVYISGAADIADEQMICGGVSSSNDIQIRVRANSVGSSMKVVTGNISSSVDGSTGLAGGDHVIAVHWDRPNHTLIARVDGVEDINQVLNDADRTALTRFTIGNRLTDFGGSSGYDGLIGDLAISARPSPWTSQEIADIESQFAALHGVTL